MSVVGFDLGCDFTKIAVAHRKKIQMVPNGLTKLITPTLTAFSTKERHFADNAQTQWVRNFTNTASQLKRWLGRKADDPRLQSEAKFWLAGMETATLSDGRFGIKVNTSQGELLLAPEQILCGFLGELKKFTKTYLDGLKVTDCVIACPSFFDDAQRRALLTAAKLAELKVLRLLEESTAIALNYGILRNLPEDETQRVVFVDVGFASTQVAVVDFVKGKLSVRYKAANPYCGGRDFDRALYERFRQEWLAKHKVDIDTKPKQKLKLLLACRKIKKLLTGNKDALWTLDCFHDDHDFQIEIHRHEMEEACTKAGLYKALVEPLIEALDATKGDKVKIHSCEIVGGPSRVPSIQQKVLQTIQEYEPDIKSLSTTLNGDESVARGCALMCAMLSPNFRVKEFQVQDILTWPITIEYPTEREDAEKKNIQQLIMKRGDPQPCTAKVMFNKTQNFVFKLQHPEQYEHKKDSVSVTYPFNTNLNIGEFNVQLLPLSEKPVQPPKIKLLLDINKQGLLNWPKASLIEYVKRDPPPPPKEEKKDKKKAKKENKTDKTAEKAKESEKDKAEDTDKEMTDKTAEEAKESETTDSTETKEEPKESTPATTDKMDVDNEEETEDKDKKKKKEKKKITRDLIITGSFFNDLKASEFNAMFELEANLINVDRIVHETDEAKNDLETYVYSLRDKIETTHKEFIKEREREKLSKDLTAMEDWVYEEGDDANKTQFLERLKQLKDIGDPMEYKLWECEHREHHVGNFKKLIIKYQQWPENKEEKYEHIGEDKRKECLKYANDADAWLVNQQIKQDRLRKYETPVLKCKDIDNRYRELYEKCNAIVQIPKPKPKTPTPPPKEEEKEKGNADTPTPKPNGDATVEKTEETPQTKDEDNDTEMTDKTKVDAAAPAAETTTQEANEKGKDAVDGMEVE
eukprot:308216_1